MAENKDVIVQVSGRYIGGALFAPKEKEDGSTRYGALIVLDPGMDSRVTKALSQAIANRFGAKPPKLEIYGVREGDDPEYENTYGKMFINPKSYKPVQTVIKRQGKVIPVTQEDGIIYPGCYVVASLSAYANPGDKTKKIPAYATLGLRVVMFYKHGERIGSYVDPNSEVSEFGDSEDTEAAGAFSDDGLGDAIPF